MFDLTKVRVASGTQTGGFEELCVHLAEAICEEPLRERLRIHGAGGDDGVEAIVTTVSARRVGIQCKYFRENLSSTQWTQIKKSVRQAMLKHPELSEYIVCVPRDRTPGQIRTWKALVSEWKSSYPNVKMIWIGQSELVHLLVQPRWRYLATYWLGAPEFSSSWLVRKLEQAIFQLHKRFTPKLHNTTQAEKDLAVMLAFSESLCEYKELCRNLVAGAHDLLGMLARATQNLCGPFAASNVSVQAAVRELRASIADGQLQAQGTPFAAALNSLAEAAGDVVRVAREQEMEARHIDSEVAKDAKEWLPGIRRVALGVQASAKPVSQAFAAHHEGLRRPLWLLLGRAGTGKSHLLASAAQKALARDMGAVLLLGEQFLEGRPLPQQIVDLLGWEYSFTDLLGCLRAQSEASGKPSLILIDAINESPQRGLWRSHLSQLVREIDAFPGVHLLLSCRDDWLPECVSSSLVDGASRLVHRGYDRNFEAAVKSYFQGYNVAAKVFPSFTPEFRNPLFLKTVCETYQDRKLPDEPLSFVAVLDAWEKRACEKVQQAIDCPSALAMRAIERIIGQMAVQHAASILAEDAENICFDIFPNRTVSGSLYRALQSVGVIEEVSNPDGLLVRLQYERFYEVKVARFEMRQFEDATAWLQFWSDEILPHIDGFDVAVASEARLFAYALLLPEMFDLELVECGFPEPDETGYSRIDKIWDVWLEALAWRKIPSAHDRIRRLFVAWERTGEPPIAVFYRLMSFAAIECHPLNADFLHSLLWSKPLVDREVFWTVPLGYEDLSNEREELGRFIGWCEAAGPRCSDEQARLASGVLLWLTSSTNQKNRDCATDSTIRLLQGRHVPTSQLVDHFWEVDDPYVKERLLAVVAGVVPTLSRDALRTVGGEVCTRFFGGEQVPPNIMQREYARFIAEYCIYQHVLSDELQRRARPPYRTVMPQIWSEDQVRTLDDDRVFNTIRRSLQPEESGRMYGDFGRYVMQSAVQKFTDPAAVNTAADRLSERYPREDPRAAQRFILQRVVELGWPDARGELDRFERSIRSDGRQRSPMERISKKFQWIGLYEYTGFLSDHRKLRCFSEELIDFSSASELNLRDYDPALAFFPKTSGNRGLLAQMEADTCNPIPAMDAEADRSAWIASDFEDFTRYLHVAIGGEPRLVLSAHLSFDEPLPFGVNKESVQHAAQWVNLYSFIVSEKDTAALSAELGQKTFWGHGVDLPKAYAGWVTEYPWHGKLDDIERECSSGHRLLAGAKGLFHGTVCAIGSEDQPFALPSPGVCREMGKSALGVLSPPQQTATGDFSIRTQDRREVFWGSVGGSPVVAASYREFMGWLRERNWNLVVCLLSERTVNEGPDLLAQSHQSAVIVVRPFEAPMRIPALRNDWKRSQNAA